MSLPVKVLICSKCGAKCDVSMAGRPQSTEAYYLQGGYVAPVLKRKEWCSKCERLVPATNTPSPDEIDQHLSTFALGRGKHAPDDQIENELLLLNRLFIHGKSAWKEWSARQAFHGCRCACGTPTSLLQKIQSDTPWSEEFMHPICGGTLRWKDAEGGLRISLRRPTELQISFLDEEGELYREGESARVLLLQLFDELDKNLTSQTVEVISQTTFSVGRLSIHKSPFFLLGVSTRDSRKFIVERAEEQSLALDPASCQQARSELTNPRTRLAAEVAWLPGVSPRRTTALLDSLTTDPFSVRSEAGIPTLAHCNLMASAFEAVSSNHSAADVAVFAEQFARQVDELDTEVVRRAVNEDRAISGFPAVRGVELVQEEIAQRKRIYRNAIKDALNQLPPNELIGAMTRLLESTTFNGTRHAPELVDELVDSYAIETQQFLKQEAENAETLISSARASASKGDAVVKTIIDRLEAVLRNWDKVAQPLQLSFKARGLDHEASKALAYKVRSLAIDLFNEHDNLNQATRLTQLLKELFFEVPDILDYLEEDEKTLEDIFSRRVESLANEKNLILKIQENLAIVEGNHKSLGDLEPIKSAPSLYTINGFGVTLYGNTDKNPSDGSYMATYYLVFFFVPVLPLARYRVIPTGGGYRFLGKGPLRVFDKWHIAISLVLITWIFLKA